MKDAITICVPGEPKGKGRARSVYIQPKGRPGFISTYTPKATRSYEGELKFFAQQSMGSRELLEGPLNVLIEARFSVPASWSNKKRASALAGILRPTGKPDCDNIAKSGLDGLNKIVFRDDSQCVDVMIRKLYAEKPSLVIKIARAEVLLLQSEIAA